MGYLFVPNAPHSLLDPILLAIPKNSAKYIQVYRPKQRWIKIGNQWSQGLDSEKYMLYDSTRLHRIAHDYSKGRLSKLEESINDFL